MSTITMSLKIDPKVKKQAQAVARNLGFPLSTLLNAYMRQLVKNKDIYFSSKPFKMSNILENELTEVEKDIKSGKNISPRFANTKKAISYLKK